MKIDVRHIAKLANLPLSETESGKFEKQLSDVLEYVKKLEGLDTSGVEPTSQVTGLENILREDAVTNSLSQEQALSGTGNKHNGFFAVKGILDRD